MNVSPGSNVEVDGIYWCTVCKTPALFEQGKVFPACPNLCSKGHWELVLPSTKDSADEAPR